MATYSYDDIQTARQGVLTQFDEISGFDASKYIGNVTAASLSQQYNPEVLAEQTKNIYNHMPIDSVDSATLQSEYTAQGLQSVQQAYDVERGMLQRDMSRMGVDPSSGRALSMQQKRALELAKNKTGVLASSFQRARKEARDEEQRAKESNLQIARDLTLGGAGGTAELFKIGLEAGATEREQLMDIQSRKADILEQQAEESVRLQGFEEETKRTREKIAAEKEKWTASLAQQREFEKARLAQKQAQFNQKIAYQYEQLKVQRSLAQQRLRTSYNIARLQNTRLYPTYKKSISGGWVVSGYMRR